MVEESCRRSVVGALGELTWKDLCSVDYDPPEMGERGVAYTVEESDCFLVRAELGEQEMKDSCCSELVVLSCLATLNLSGSSTLKECYHSGLVVLE